jgi:hypothetical protein
MSYILRDKNGLAKAKVTNTVFFVIIKKVKGYFKDKSFKDEKQPITCYIIDEDCFLNNEFVGIKLYFWKDDYLMPE